MFRQVLANNSDVFFSFGFQAQLTFFVVEKVTNVQFFYDHTFIKRYVEIDNNCKRIKKIHLKKLTRFRPDLLKSCCLSMDKQYNTELHRFNILSMIDRVFMRRLY